MGLGRCNEEFVGKNTKEVLKNIMERKIRGTLKSKRKIRKQGIKNRKKKVNF